MAKILVADDDSATRRWLAGILRREHEVLEADAAGALAAAEQAGVDVAILDAGAAVMNAPASLKAMNRATGDPFLPVLLMTSSHDESLLAAGIEAGADDIIFKPVSPALLGGKVRALLRARASASDARANEGARALPRQRRSREQDCPQGLREHHSRANHRLAGGRDPIVRDGDVQR